MSGGSPLKGNIQLFVTRRCQLRCRYCPILKGESVMSLETALKGVDFLIGHHSARLRLDFGGGEPLLNFDVVRESARYARRRARDAGKSMGFYMVTNAILLEERVLEWARREGVLLELSMDGARADHNRFKSAYARGLDPYEATRAGARRAREAGVDHFVIMVASPANVTRLAENFEHLLDEGVRSVDISYAIGGIWSEEDERTFFAQLELILVRHAGPLGSGELRLGNARQRVEPTILNSELMLDPDGTLHQMSEWMFETTPARRPPPYPLGRVEEGGDINRLRWSRFHALRTLTTMHAGDRRVLEAVHNNIVFGRRVGEYFARASGRLGQVPA